MKSARFLVLLLSMVVLISFSQSSSFASNAVVANLYNVFQSSPSVYNSQWQALPSTWNALMARPQVGGAGLVTPGATYGGKASASAVYLVPPAAKSDSTNVYFYGLKPDPKLTHYLNFGVGLLDGMNSGGAVRLNIVVGGDAVIADEPAWQIIYSAVILPNQQNQISVPLGLWPLRKNFHFSIQAQKVDDSNGQSMLVINAPNLASGLLRPESGIARSNLVWASADHRSTVAKGASDLRARWFRDGPRAGTEEQFVDLVRKVKSRGIKMLAVIMADAADYDGNPYLHAGEAFKDLCGWSAGTLPLSKVNLTKFESRLRKQLTLVKNAGLTIDAFEIGNELDWICFNGDVPYGRVATAADELIIARAYARFLMAAAKVIRDPALYPSAQLITFGMANIPSSHRREFHLENPANIIRLMENIDGVNYLSNSKYKVAGIGVHIYPDVENIAEDTQRVLNAGHAIAGRFNLPYWITEWGLATSNSQRALFPNSRGQTRAQGMLEFLTVLNSQFGQMKFGPEFFYGYDTPGEHFGLVDEQGRYLHEAQVLSLRYGF